jgi:Bacterial regulatory protein, arsR family
MVVGEIGNELEIPSSTLSHHLEKLKIEDLGRALMALTGRRPAEIFFSAKFSLPRKKLHFRARSLWTNPGNRATSGAPTAPACHKFKPKNQTDDIFVALVPRP